jgi:hypothetical protein
MTHKIYLIKHLDTGMGYVGITGDELGKRWYQHLHDPASAVYKALRADGHRITMELLEEVETRGEALLREQEYIHSLGTAQPAGWNRQIKTKLEPKQKRWKSIVWNGIKFSSYSYDEAGTIICPACFIADGTCDGQFVHIEKVTELHEDYESTVTIYIQCETCDSYNDDKPTNYLELHTTHGQTTAKYYYFVEDKK